MPSESRPSGVRRRRFLSATAIAGVIAPASGCLDANGAEDRTLIITTTEADADRYCNEYIRGTDLDSASEDSETSDRTDAIVEAIERGEYTVDVHPFYPRHIVEHDGNYYRVDVEYAADDETWVYARTQSFDTREEACDAMVGTLVVELRNDTFGEAFPVFETAITEGEYTASPLEGPDETAVELLQSGFAEIDPTPRYSNSIWYDGGYYLLEFSLSNE